VSDTKKENQEMPETGEKEEVSAAEEAPAGDAATQQEAQAALAAAKEEAARHYDQYVRACADLENYRKRAQREKEDLSRFANENLLREFLPVLDNLERAVEHASTDEGDAQGLLEGVRMTMDQFRKALGKFGVTPIEALGKPFDSAVHEAMGQLESADEPPNTVAQELQKGYLLNDRLLRPALVMVTRAAAKKPETETN